MSEKETEVEVERSGILQNKLPAPIHPIELESQTEKKVRYRSIRIGQVALLIFSIGFSIVLTGVYPYMTQVRNPHNAGLKSKEKACTYFTKLYYFFIFCSVHFLIQYFVSFIYTSFKRDEFLISSKILLFKMDLSIVLFTYIYIIAKQIVFELLHPFSKWYV